MLTILDFTEISHVHFSEHTKKQKGDFTLKFDNCIATKSGKKLSFLSNLTYNRLYNCLKFKKCLFYGQ